MIVLFQIILNLGLVALGGVVLFFVFRHIPGPDGKDHCEDVLPRRKKREDREDGQ